MESCDVVRDNKKMKYGSDMEFRLLTVPRICEPLTGQPITFAVQHFKHLSTLDLADSGMLVIVQTSAFLLELTTIGAW